MNLNDNLQEYMNFAKDVAKEAGNIMIKYFGKNNGSYYKEDNTIVTTADNEINAYLINQVKKFYSTHAVDGEEEKFGKSEYVWVCDPIDGTCPYSCGIPVSVFSLALVINGVSVLGVVYDPFTKNMYHAIKGKGAFKNNKEISVNNIMLDDKKSVAHFDSWPSAEYDISSIMKVLGKRTYFLSTGSIIRSCMCIAEGNFNLAIYPGTKNKNCDIAAVKIIVEEAGGKVTNLFGQEQRYDKIIKVAVISNGVVHEEVLNIIDQYLNKKSL